MAGWTRTRAALAILGAIVVLGGGGAFAWRQAAPASFEAAFSGFEARIFPDKPGPAIEYYKRISATLDLGLLNAADAPAANLDQLLDYFGYAGVKAEDVEALKPVELMPKDQAAFDILAARLKLGGEHAPTFATWGPAVRASRFFAPKIVDYTGAPPYAPGWRKLVRLEALEGSRAKGKRLAAMYLLFNYATKDTEANPFNDGPAHNISKNNQVILVPEAGAFEDTVFFLVYDKGPAYPLVTALTNVAFDLPSNPQIPEDAKGSYFVPGSCAQCHGHDAPAGNGSPTPKDRIYRQARLNYLDTDQWHDAMAYDFPNQKGDQAAVVFDGGTTVASPEYKAAFGVLRELNTAIEAQNRLVSTTDFKTAAAAKWVELHKTSDAPAAMRDRVLTLGTLVWNPVDGSPDKAALEDLNHYCFRCHSSIRFNVFDKKGVERVVLSDQLENRVKADKTSPIHMPQGRELADPKGFVDRVLAAFP